jgi:hypothetical protein
VTFVGRLATYRYYNIDQGVGQALATYRKRFAPDRAAASSVQAVPLTAATFLRSPSDLCCQTALGRQTPSSDS